MKSRSILFSAVLLLTISCSQGKYMTFDDYHKIAIGQNISDIQVQVGRPYEINERSPHSQEYIYIERLSLGGQREMFRRYILIVDHDKVIEKKLVEEVSSPIQIVGS